MSRLTDLRSIYGSLSAPLSKSVITVMPEVVGCVERARANIYELIQAEEQALDRAQVVKATYDYDHAAWAMHEPVKPWQEQAQYEQAMRTWKAAEPILGGFLSIM